MSIVRIFFIVLVFAFLVPVIAQQSERSISRKIWKEEPLEIVSLQIQRTTVDFNQRFLNGNDWFSGLAIEVKNTSAKTIVFIDITLIFPAGGETVPASEHLLYGQSPLAPGETDDAPPIENQPPLPPNSTATLVLTNYQETRQFLDEVNQPQSIKEVIVEIGEAIFSDGTKWSRGASFRRKPSNPHQWFPAHNRG